MKKIRFFLGLWAAKFLMFIYKIIGNEKDDRPGLLAYRFCDDFINYINKPKLVIGVTGTNGKTTVSSMICDFLRLDNKKVSYNDWGANNIAGQTRCLLDAVNIFNKPKKDAAILEIDEMTSNYTLPRIKPNYIIITNLFRDSIKRNGYISFIKERLEEGFNKVNSTIIINADDPILNTLKIKNKCIYYGVEKTKDSINIPFNSDFPICPKCYNKIKYIYQHYRHLGKVSCKCGFKSKESDFLATNIDYKDMSFTYNYENKENKIKILSPNLFNVFNVLSVVALFKTMKYSDDKIKNYISKIKIPVSRENYITYNNKRFDLQVAKGQNGSSASTVFEEISNIKDNMEIIIMLDEAPNIKDKSETVTWIYETDFSYLNNKNIKKIIILSYLGLDYKIAMMLNGVDKEKIILTDKEEDVLSNVTFNNIDRIMILFDVENITKPRILREKIREKFIKENK